MNTFSARLIVLISILGLLMSCAHDSPSHQAVQVFTPARYPTSDGGQLKVVPVHTQPTAGDYMWPVKHFRMSRGFLPRRRRPHYGLDLAAPKGTPIMAARGGTVLYRGKGFHGFGKMVMIQSEDGSAAIYGHLDKYYVVEGQRISMGEVIGAMGRTGHATGVHLHFEVRPRNGKPIDPLPLLPRGSVALGN